MDHVFVLYDRMTNSVWYPKDDSSLQAVGGARKGSSVPFLDEPAPVSLGAWLDAHPDSTILLASDEDVAAMQRHKNRAYLGVRFSERDGALVIDEVTAESPAAAAGMRTGDIIRGVGGIDVRERSDLREILREHKPGDTVEITVQRNGDVTTVPVTLASPP
jgi:membrane-associated protease RseP (regulator of RpoE activity)